MLRKDPILWMKKLTAGLNLLGKSIKAVKRWEV
jgi:hypothetical protein